MEHLRLLVRLVQEKSTTPLKEADKTRPHMKYCCEEDNQDKDKYKDKLLKKPYMCNVFEKQGVQGD